MITVSDKKLCSCCFAEISSEPCPECGYPSERYVSDPAVLPCGSMLRKRYIVGRVIGKGGFGITYLAYDTKLERKVAIKEFYPYGLASRNIGDTVVIVSSEETAEAFRNGAEKFYNEARLIARFNGDPGIVGVYDFFYENATVYFTMEYLNGQTLRDYIARHGVLSEGQAVFLAEKISMALMTVHSANVLHRGISPDNIMLCADGNIKLIDFGAARQVVANCSNDLSVILKQGFAPLEQYQKKGKQGPWTDIYSLGASLYFALTAHTPDDPMTRLENGEKISDNTEKAERIDPKLWELIRKAVMLKAADRYQNVFELRNDLAGLSLTAMPIIEPTEQQDTAIPFGVTAQPYRSTARQTANTAAPEDTRTVPLTDPSITVPLTEAPVTASLTSSDTGAPVAAPVSPAKKPQGNKKLVYAAGAAAILLIGIFSGVLISQNSNNDIATETTFSAKEQIIYDPKEGIYAIDDEQDNDVTEETTVITEEAELPVTAPEETEPEDSEPPVTEPKVTEPAAPAAPDVITIGGKSYKTNMTGTLDLSGKGLKNKDIADLKYMTKLSEIIISDNSLTDLSALSGLTQLEKLTYHNNNVSDLSFAKNLTKLKVIGAENNGITDLSPLSGMSGLEEIWLQNNNISDMSPLKKCTKVNSLSLSGNPIKDCSAASGMKKIRNLHLYGCGLKSLEPFKGCTKLEYVYIGDNQITDLTPLCGNNGLIDLYAQNNKLNGNYNAIKGLTILDILDISGNGFNDPDELYEFICSEIYSDDDFFIYYF
ncbi:MAG: leucine-rich repeat domain-containing protein [Huintestinicola sp.]|uniref:protein kinase domain-containing protein n=1 Tax=Huintestinicola sp. TaxID=2981661 RepID=UPI003F1006B5